MLFHLIRIQQHWWTWSSNSSFSESDNHLARISDTACRAPSLNALAVQHPLQGGRIILHSQGEQIHFGEAAQEVELRSQIFQRTVMVHHLGFPLPVGISYTKAMLGQPFSLNKHRSVTADWQWKKNPCGRITGMKLCQVDSKEYEKHVAL